MFFVPFMTMVTPTNAAVGLNVSTKTVLDGAVIGVHVEGMAVSTAYGLTDDAGTSWLANWTTSATETERYFYLQVDYPASGSSVTIGVYTASALADSKTVTVVKPDTLIPIDLLINAGISIFILLVVAALVAGFLKRRR